MPSKLIQCIMQHNTLCNKCGQQILSFHVTLHVTYIKKILKYFSSVCKQHLRWWLQKIFAVFFRVSDRKSQIASYKMRREGLFYDCQSKARYRTNQWWRDRVWIILTYGSIFEVQRSLLTSARGVVAILTSSSYSVPWKTR